MTEFQNSKQLVFDLIRHLYIRTGRNGKIIPVNNLVIGLVAQHLFYVVGFQAHDPLNISRAVVYQPDS